MDWRAFCEEYRIDTAEGGSSTKKNNLYVECPWCCNDKKRLGMDLDPPHYWGCWLDKTHRGKSSVRLIMALARISYEEACDVAGIQPNYSDLQELIGDFVQLQRNGISTVPAHNDQSDSRNCEIDPYQIPNTWFDLRPRGKLSRPFIDYLGKRGLPPECCIRYQLMASGSKHGRDQYRNRVISSVVVDGQIVAITARAIDRNPYRYLTDPDGVPNRVLFNTQHVTGGDTLVLVEGPYDAMKLDWAAHVSGLSVHTVASMGVVLSRDKETALQGLMERYKRTVVLFDQAALTEALDLQQRLCKEIEIAQLPEGISDPGEFTVRAAAAYLQKFLR